MKMDFTRYFLESSKVATSFSLVVRKAEGPGKLLDIFQRLCKELGIKLSVTKLNVMPSRKDVWELFGGDEEIGALDKPPLPPIQQ